MLGVKCDTVIGITANAVAWRRTLGWKREVQAHMRSGLLTGMWNFGGTPKPAQAGMSASSEDDV
jgi:hypothetical protein